MSKSTASDIFKDNESSNLDTDEEEAEVDDEISKPIINAKFKSKYKILCEYATSLKKVYILKTTINSSFTKLVAGMSNGIVQIFDITSNGLHKSEEINFENNSPVCGVKFIDETSNNLLIGSVSGDLKLFDLRSSDKSYTFQDKVQDRTKQTITCFDVNSNGRLICAGTDQIFCDVYLKFYDIRKRESLGNYWETHQDDITDIKFHPTKQNVLITGSLDGLINIFDVTHSSEEEALQETINTENSIQKLNWHKNVYEKDMISCITHTNDLKIYDNESDLVSMFDRNFITNNISESNDFSLINCHNSQDDSVFALVGSNFNKGENLKSFKIQYKTLLPLTTFEGNKQIIRDSLFNSEKNILITSGESGIITLWSPEQSIDQTDISKLKIKSNEKIHKKKPY